MPNVPIPIELDKTRHLYFDFNALVVVGDNIDIPIDKLLTNIRGALNLKTIRALLLGGLYHEDRSLTAEKVGRLLDPMLKKPEELVKIGDTLRAALMAAFADETGEAEKKETGRVPAATIPKSRGRGKNS
ncbi:MAG: hypothetical protein PHC52_13615 [Syntrophales bacterium]|nr:hypothetical protein [Syntrophales bacterium]